ESALSRRFCMPSMLASDGRVGFEWASTKVLSRRTVFGSSHAPVSLLFAGAARRSQGGGNHFAPPDAAGGHAPPAGFRSLFVAAARLQGADEGAEDHRGGAGSLRCDPVAHAHDPVSRPVARIRAL